MPELTPDVKKEIFTGLGIEAAGLNKSALKAMKEQVYKGVPPRDVLARLANVGQREVTEKVIDASLKNAFREVQAGAVVEGDVTQRDQAQQEAHMWHTLYLQGPEGLPNAEAQRVAQRMVEATADVFQDPDLFQTLPNQKVTEGILQIMNSQPYRDALKTRLDTVLLEAQGYDPAHLDAAVTDAEGKVTAAEAAYRVTPGDANLRSAWEQSLVALDRARERRATPYGGIGEMVRNIGKDALIEILPARTAAAGAEYETKAATAKTEAETKTRTAQPELAHAWKRRIINRRTMEESEVVDKARAKKLKKQLMRKGSEGLLEEVLRSKKVNGETREVFARLKTESPEEYALLKAKTAAAALKDYLEGGGKITKRELKKIVKKGHEADLYQIVAMSIRGKDSPTAVAANDLKIDETLVRYLKKTPIDRVKDTTKWLFTTPQGRILLLASLGAGAGSWWMLAGRPDLITPVVAGASNLATNIKAALLGYQGHHPLVDAANLHYINAIEAYNASSTPANNTAMHEASVALAEAMKAHPLVDQAGLVKQAQQVIGGAASTVSTAVGGVVNAVGPTVQEGAKNVGEYAFGTPENPPPHSLASHIGLAVGKAEKNISNVIPDVTLPQPTIDTTWGRAQSLWLWLTGLVSTGAGNAKKSFEAGRQLGNQ